MNRYLEIDVIKGIAVILMIIFHIFYLMNNMGMNQIDSSKGIIALTAPLAHYSFLIFCIFLQNCKRRDRDKLYN